MSKRKRLGPAWSRGDLSGIDDMLTRDIIAGALSEQKEENDVSFRGMQVEINGIKRTSGELANAIHRLEIAVTDLTEGVSIEMAAVKRAVGSQQHLLDTINAEIDQMQHTLHNVLLK